MSYDLTDKLSVSLGGRYTWTSGPAKSFAGVSSGAARRISVVGHPVPRRADRLRGHGQIQEVYAARFSQLRARCQQHRLRQLHAGLQRRRLRSALVDPQRARPRQQWYAQSGRSSEYVGFDPETVDNYEIGYKASLSTVAQLRGRGFYANIPTFKFPVPCPASAAERRASAASWTMPARPG